MEIERIVNNFQNEFQNGTLADQKDQIQRFVKRSWFIDQIDRECIAIYEKSR